MRINGYYFLISLFLFSMFVVIEALDAGGSQTQTDRLAERLKKEGNNVLQLHFPQEDQPTGRFVYEKFLLSKNKPKFSRREQALIYLQDFYSRADDIKKHLSGVVNPPDKGDGGGFTGKLRRIVVSDRFYTSTMAYQTIGLTGRERKAMLAWIKFLAEQGTIRLPKPDMVIFLDTPVNISLNHLKGKKKDFFENKKKLTAIRNSYLRLAKEEKWIIINSVNDRGEQRLIEDIHQEIWQIV